MSDEGHEGHRIWRIATRGPTWRADDLSGTGAAQDPGTRSEEYMLKSLHLLADAHCDVGQYDAALLLYQRCLQAYGRLLGPEHPDTLTTVGNLLGLYRRKGDYEQVERLFKRALEVREHLLGPEHPSTLTTLGNLSLLYSSKGDYEQA